MLEFGATYHVYNRGNNKENLFREDENYAYFLRLYVKHIVPIADTYAYCLLRNHFHMAVRIKTAAEQAEYQQRLVESEVIESWQITDIKNPSKQFSNLFNAYSKAVNKRYGRTGSLFQKPFRRKYVETERYLRRLIHYIHLNPQHHGFVNDFRSYPNSSYAALVSEHPVAWISTEALQIFGGRNEFLREHTAHLISTNPEDDYLEDESDFRSPKPVRS